MKNRHFLILAFLCLYILVSCNNKVTKCNMQIEKSDSAIILNHFDSYYNFLLENKHWYSSSKGAFVITIADYNENTLNFSISYILNDYNFNDVNAKYYFIHNNKLILFRSKTDIGIPKIIGGAKEIMYDDLSIIFKYLMDSKIASATYEPVYFVVKCSNENCDVETTMYPEKRFQSNDFEIDSSQFIFHNNLNEEQFDSLIHRKNN